MDQQNKSSIVAQNPLDFIVSALHKKKKKSESFQEKVSLKQLYETVNSVVTGLDESIKNCKTYNEARIYRKYEILLSDQNKRIKFLQQKIREQHKARSPSKKYVQDLLDKLINYKFQNEVLVKQNAELTQQNAQLKKKLQIYEEHTPTTDRKQQEMQQKQKQALENLSMQISGISIKNQLTSYLRLKNQLRKHENVQKTRFQRFLKKIKDKIQTWSMRQFLQAIDKWSTQPIAESAVSPQQQMPKTNKTMTGYNLSVNNSSSNRSPTTKNQIRSRKTISYRHIVINKSAIQGILR